MLKRKIQAVYCGKVVVLTGATQGIGRQMCLRLADAGAHVVMAARSRERLDALTADCASLPGSVLAVPTDIASEPQCRTLMAEARRAHGRIDVLINNAGLSMWSRVDELEDLDLLRRIMDVNYLGSAYCAYHALPFLKETRGRLGLVASLTGRIPVPTRAPYAASKIAAARFHESLRVELHGSGVSVTVTFPDWVATTIRENSLGPDNKPLGHSPAQEEHMMTAADCADIALTDIALRRRGRILSLRGNVAVLMKQFWPGLVELIARRAIHKGK